MGNTFGNALLEHKFKASLTVGTETHEGVLLVINKVDGWAWSFRGVWVLDLIRYKRFITKRKALIDAREHGITISTQDNWLAHELTAVAKKYGVTSDQILDKGSFGRRGRAQEARREVYHYLWSLGYGYAEIGRLVGGRTSGTVYTAMNGRKEE